MKTYDETAYFDLKNKFDFVLLTNELVANSLPLRCDEAKDAFYNAIQDMWYKLNGDDYV